MIIDVGDKMAYAKGHVGGAVNIPYDDLINNYREYLNKYDTYYLTCKSGKLSKRACAILSYLGYKTYDYK